MPPGDPQTALKSSSPRTLSILLGFLFLIPAVLGCGATQLLLSIGTFVDCLQKGGLQNRSEFVGLANFTHMFQDQSFLQALVFTFLTAAVRLLAVAFVPLLLAWGASRLGRGGRVTLRLLFTLAVVIFLPVTVALMAAITLRPDFIQVRQNWLAQPTSARLVLLYIDNLYTFGLACGLGLVFFLAAFRNPAPGKSPWKPLLIAWGIGLVWTAASALQSFALNFALTNGGPARATTSLMYFMYVSGFMYQQSGYGSAIATLILLILFLLGLIAGGLAVISGLKIGLAPRGEKNAPGGGSGGAILIVALILGLLIAVPALLLSLVPIGATFASAQGAKNPAAIQNILPLGSTLVNTFLPPLISALVIQLPFSYLGALGIGALRPLGRRSEWLLLPFCPWLFVGLAPFSLYAFELARKLGDVGKFGSLVPPLAVSVPMLVLLTLFFKGRQGNYRRAQMEGASPVRAFFTQLVLPSLPLAGLLVVAGWFAGLRDPFWSIVFGYVPSLRSLDVTLMAFRLQYYGAVPVLASLILQTYLPIVAFFFLAFGAFQVFYLDRLSLSTGDKD